jgi:hypothetical protein
MTADDEQYARHLRETYATPLINVDPDVIVRRGRRRRTSAWSAGAVALVVVALSWTLVGLPRSTGPGPAVAPPPEPADAQAALVISPGTVHAGDAVAVTILNRGPSDLIGGVDVEAQRWDGRAWAAAGAAGLCFGWDPCESRIDPNAGTLTVPSVGIPAPSGGSSAPLGLSTAGLTPGWYRLSMTVVFDSSFDSSAAGAQRSVTAFGQFEVIAPAATTATPTATDNPAPTTTAAEPPATPQDPSTVIADAIFGQAGQAVVTKDGATLLTIDAGAHWSALSVPGTRIGGHWLDVHGATIAAASLDPSGRLTYERSSDAGKTWTSQRLPLAMPDGGQVDVTLDGAGATVAIAAQLPHSSGTPGVGTLFVGPAGRDLVPRPAPAAGTASWVGTHLLFVGGVVSSRLFVSDDLGATWTQSTVEGVTVSGDAPIPADAPSIGLPVTSAAGRAILPVTLFNGGTSSVVDLLATSDGRTFTSLAQIPTGGTWGAGVTAVGTSAGPDGTIFADLSSAGLITVTGSDVTTVTPRGLPGPGWLTFSDAAHGLAFVTVSTCPGKASCTTTTSLYASTDGGHTWTAIAPTVG